MAGNGRSDEREGVAGERRERLRDCTTVRTRIWCTRMDEGSEQLDRE